MRVPPIRAGRRAGSAGSTPARRGADPDSVRGRRSDSDRQTVGSRRPWRQRHRFRGHRADAGGAARGAAFSSSSIASTVTRPACMLVAKKRAALVELHAQLREGGVDKRYLVLVRGRWRDEKRAVRLPLAQVGDQGRRAARPGRGRRGAGCARPSFAGKPCGRTTIRRWRCWRRSSRPGERTRSACISRISDFPIAGDDKYGDFAWNNALAKAGLKRMFLHAKELDVPPSGIRRSGALRIVAAGRPRRFSGAAWTAPMRDPAARRYRLLVFDWDGTLADSTTIIAEAIQAALRDLGETVPERDPRPATSSGSALPTRYDRCARASRPSAFRACRALPQALSRARGRYSAVRRRGGHAG